MNAFSAFAETAIPKALARKQERADKAPTELEKKLAEKQRLHRAYRIIQRDRVRAVLASEPRLKAFTRYLKTVNAGDSDELIEAVADSWLMQAPQPVRLYALRLIDARCDKINREFGIPPLDDPLPPETSTYFRARDLLHAGGRA